MASASTPSSSWLLDSGASHHVTNEVNNLSLHALYDGTEEPVIGDGSTLPILNTGSFSHSTSTNTFKFFNVLHVPTISIISSVFPNYVKIIILALSSYPIFFVLRNFHKGKFFSRGQLKMAFMSGNRSHHKSARTFLRHPSLSILMTLNSNFCLRILDFSISNYNSCNI